MNSALVELKDKLTNLISVKSHLTVPQLCNFLESYIGFYVSKRYKINPKILYRLRVNCDRDGNPIDLFLHESDLWAPDPKKNRLSKGRCNLEGDNILYASDHPITCLSEFANDLKRNKKVTIVLYKIESEIPLTVVAVNTLINSMPDYAKIFNDYYGNLKEDKDFKLINLVDEIIANEFMKVRENSEDRNFYNFTIAWTKLCFEHNKNKCIIYPSTVSGLKTGNWAIEANYARDFLKPYKIYTMKLGALNNVNGSWRIAIDMDKEGSFDKNGYINWVNIDFLPTEYITDKPLTNNPFEPNI